MRALRIRSTLLALVLVLVPAAGLQAFDVEPFVKFFFDQRPVPTAINLSSLPACCLGAESAWRTEIEATLALVPDTPCNADNGLGGSTGDLLFTPFQTVDGSAREKNDGRTIFRFKNQGQMTLGVTTFWVAGESQSCGGNDFSRTADADVALNRQVDWVNDPGSPFCPGSPDHYSLRSTLLHEFGHVVGLEHTNVEAALMFPFGDACDFTKEAFLSDDQAQFDFIYACENADCSAAGGGGGSEKKCRDGVDNDGDGLVDCADPDCASKRFCN